MNFFYAFNDAYAALAGISIFSLLKNNVESEKIRIYIVDSGISQKNIEKIKCVVNSFGRQVEFYTMPNFDEILGKDVDTGRWNINVYSKLFVGSILPENVHKIISIDCDTVIDKSLEELWNVDLTHYIVAGVNEAMSKYYKQNLGKSANDIYLNSGLLVLNVDAIREEEYEQRFLECINKYGSALAYLDQDAINAVVPQDRILEVHPKFNAITPIFVCSYRELLKTRRANNYYPEDIYTEARTNPHIIHFTTFFMNDLRPWFEGSKHPKIEIFLKYKDTSPWKDEPLWKDNRKGGKKIKADLIKALPRGLQCQISSVLHGVIVPKQNGKKMSKFAMLYEERIEMKGIQ